MACPFLKESYVGYCSACDFLYIPSILELEQQCFKDSFEFCVNFNRLHPMAQIATLISHSYSETDNFEQTLTGKSPLTIRGSFDREKEKAKIRSNFTQEVSMKKTIFTVIVVIALFVGPPLEYWPSIVGIFLKQSNCRITLVAAFE